MLGSVFTLTILVKSITSFIANKMRNKMLDYVLHQCEEPFSLMFDESILVSVKTCLTLYIRIPYEAKFTTCYWIFSEIRWVSLTFQSVHAIIESYPALVNYFEKQSKSTDRSTKENSTCERISEMLKKWFFVTEATMIHVALDVIRNLSLYLQKRDASVLTANAEVQNAIKTLRATKEGYGICSKEFILEYSTKCCFKDIEFPKPTQADEKKFHNLKLKFFQSLVDNISHRLLQCWNICPAKCCSFEPG